MAVITYTAQRSVMANHVVGTQYTFEILLNKFDRIPKRKQNTATSLSGLTQTLLHRIDISYQAATIPTNSQNKIDQLREFLDSVAAGEEFTLDALGSLSEAHAPQTYKVEGDYAENMVDITGYYSFSFKCKL